MTQQLVVTALNIYPVKSLRGIGVEHATLEPMGFRHDRRWMLVNAQRRFMTQREYPRMCLVETALTPSGLVLSMPGHGQVTVPYDNSGGQSISTDVFGDRCETLDQGDSAADWLAQALNLPEPPRLVRMQPDYQRPQRRPERYGANTTTVFADGAPYLVANQASLDWLNQKLTEAGFEPVPMNRFRPNIVVAGLPALAEHRHGKLAGPGYQLRMCYPCERCSIPTVDQDTALANQHRQPWKMLREINPMPAKALSPAFAENTVLLGPAGATARVGDALLASQR